MKPLVEFADAEAAMRSYVLPLWAARAELWKPAPTKITTDFPSTALAEGVTALQITLDGTPTVEYPATERATVRFTFWGHKNDSSKVKRGAVITQAFVATHPGDSSVFSTRILTGRLRGTDPATGNQFASFTARISLRPTAL